MNGAALVRQPAPGNPNHRSHTMSTITISRTAADRLYNIGRDQGLGYAPYADVPGPNNVGAALDAAIADGWEIIDRASTTDECTVLQDADGAIIGIGDVWGAWAVPLLDAGGKPHARGVDASGREVEVES